ncbi:MAG TPA: SulP family inorganic anion transporter, partial [Myxococcales bacterium]|nr:SulP family inorganic anion transporter [Myxococcales bacterium]
ERFGLAGRFVAGVLGGLMLLAMGLFRLGRFIEFIPHPVTTGFTAGIGTVIATLQLKDILGLHLARSPDRYFDRLAAMFEARRTFSPWELAIGGATLLALVYFPKVTKRVPAPLVALPAAALGVFALGRVLPGFHVDTIASRFHYSLGGQLFAGIPRLPPLPALPWHAGGPGGTPFHLDAATLRALLPGAFAIAMLGAIESLLSAVVADGLAGTRHDPDAELLALGIGNVVVPFFGGIPATGAIARTATNIGYGGRSPIAAIVHAFAVLAAVLALAPLLGYLPMSALAALLLLVAWNMSDAKHFVHTVRVAPKSDVAVLLTCYGLTVSFDMVVGVSAGIVLASLMFMRRMAEVTEAGLAPPERLALPGPLPPGVVVYDINGPLFFGAAQKAMATLGIVGERTRAVVLRLDNVPAIDATGIVALESALASLEKRGCLAVLTGLRKQPTEVLRKARVTQREGVAVAATLSQAIELAATAQQGDHTLTAAHAV